MNTNAFEPLFETVEKYGNTSVELIKLKTVKKTSEVMALFISHLLLIMLGIVCLTALNISVALWIGKIVNENYIGFLIVSGFYAVLVLSFFMLLKPIKEKINNSIIINLLK